MDCNRHCAINVIGGICHAMPHHAAGRLLSASEKREAGKRQCSKMQSCSSMLCLLPLIVPDAAMFLCHATSSHLTIAITITSLTHSRHATAQLVFLLFPLSSSSSFFYMLQCRNESEVEKEAYASVEA